MQTRARPAGQQLEYDLIAVPFLRFLSTFTLEALDSGEMGRLTADQPVPPPSGSCTAAPTSREPRQFLAATSHAEALGSW
jgi:hypothetical protein